MGRGGGWSSAGGFSIWRSSGGGGWQPELGPEPLRELPRRLWREADQLFETALQEAGELVQRVSGRTQAVVSSPIAGCGRSASNAGC